MTDPHGILSTMVDPYDLASAGGVYDPGDGGERVYEWYDDDGNAHRDDGPAVIYTTADDEFIGGVWLRHGERHRIGGPAVEDPGGCEWWLWLTPVTEDDHDLIAMLPADALAAAERIVRDWPEDEPFDAPTVVAQALAETHMPAPEDP